MALIVPPLPAVSRPSKTTQTLAPVVLTHSCIATSSPCRRRSSCSYSFRFIGWACVVAGTSTGPVVSTTPGSRASRSRRRAPPMPRACWPSSSCSSPWLPLSPLRLVRLDRHEFASVTARARADGPLGVDDHRRRGALSAADPLARLDDDREEQGEADAGDPLLPRERGGQQTRAAGRAARSRARSGTTGTSADRKRLEQRCGEPAVGSRRFVSALKTVPSPITTKVIVSEALGWSVLGLVGPGDERE